MLLLLYFFRIPPFDSMLSFICKRKFPPNNQNPIFITLQTPLFTKPFSSAIQTTTTTSHDPNQSFTISYLINSCGLSPNDAVSTSKKLTIKSPENPDAVLKALSKYGFTITNSNHIPKLVKRWPHVLVSSPDKTLLPKLKFLCSFGVPLSILAEKISVYPLILVRSLDNYLVPTYNYLKGILQSDENVVTVFKRAPRSFAHGWKREISVNVEMLRERGLPESSIAKLLASNPSTLMLAKTKLGLCVDRAEELGFDKSRFMFIAAIQVLCDMSDLTLKRKMEVYRKCGWSESDINAGFLRYPICLSLSEEKIVANMDFLVNEVGYKASDVSVCPALLGMSLDRRIRPRWLVLGVLKSKGLLKKCVGINSWFMLSEKRFLDKYIFKNTENIPRLLEFYRGKVSREDLLA